MVPPLRVAPSLAVHLPAGWSRSDDPGGPIDFRPQDDGALGLMQASLLRPDEFTRLQRVMPLGPEAAAFGLQSNPDATVVGHQDAPCAMGRMAFVLLRSQRTPALMVWLTLSNAAGWLWTFAGPDEGAPALKQAMQVAVSAKVILAPLPVRL